LALGKGYFFQYQGRRSGTVNLLSMK
jgi:hypothetical protein